jgi:DNA-binding NtrC family response regulator
MPTGSDPKRLLVLDDDPASQAHIEEVFAADHLAIDFCDRVAEAVRSAKEGCFCAVVDVGIADTPWEQAVDILKAVDDTLPVILTASHNTRELETKVREQQIFYYYIKSFDAEELRLAVLEAMRRPS